MRNHILVHSATTKICANSFIFKNKIEKEGLPRDSPAGLGAGGPEFKSRRPDQNIPRVFFSLLKARFTQTHLWNSARQDVWIYKSFSFHEFATGRICKNTGRQECCSEIIERRQVKRTPSGKYRENHGTLCISRLINLRKCKSVITHSGQPELRNVSQFVFLIVQF